VDRTKQRLAAWLVAVTLPTSSDDGDRKPPRLEYTMRCELDGTADRLEVDLVVTGLDPAKRDLAFELPLWGEWIELDEYYVTRVRAAPPVKHDLVNRFYWRPVLPADWGGRLELHYELPIVALQSAAHERHGLLPWRMPSYVHAFTANTLMRLLVGGERQDADRRLELIAAQPKPGSPSWHVVTGWGGVSESRQSIVLPPGADNTALFFGEIVGRSTMESGTGGAIDVVQFGRHVDRTPIVLELAHQLRGTCALQLGVLPPGAETLVITEPGLGGTHVEGAIALGHPEAGAKGELEVGTAHFLAHEMFHAWLPGVLKAKPRTPGVTDGGDGLEWFFEGFTEYFSLWHLASLGKVTPQEFADRVRWFERLCRESSAFGEVAFADPAVNWREPAAESIAYKGGMLLAFHLDVELRALGEPGLPQLFRDLMAENAGRYDLAALRNWCVANGLEETWQRLVERPAEFAVDDALVRIGYRERREGENRILLAEGGDVDAFFRFEPAFR
jgi:hypothetical protein